MYKEDYFCLPDNELDICYLDYKLYDQILILVLDNESEIYDLDEIKNKWNIHLTPDSDDLDIANIINKILQEKYPEKNIRISVDDFVPSGDEYDDEYPSMDGDK